MTIARCSHATAKVWLFGAEFEIVDITAYNQSGGVTYGDRTYGEGFIQDTSNPTGPWIENPNCPGCIPGYPVVPRLDSGDIPIKDANNPFPEFATDLLNRIAIEPIRVQLDEVLLQQLPGSGHTPLVV